jgi:hypothetical protein
MMTFQLSFMCSFSLKGPLLHRFPLGSEAGYLVMYGGFTVLSLIVWDMMFYLFAAPCLIGGKGCMARCCDQTLTWISELLGYVCFLAVMLLSWKFVWQDGLVGANAIDNEEFMDIFHKCIFSRYVVSLCVVWPLVLVTRRFNLFCAWGQPEISPYRAVNGEDPPVWSVKNGIIPHGDDLLIATMTLQEAKATAMRMEGCKGITFPGEIPKNPSALVTANFKTASVAFPPTNKDDKWTSLVKPQAKLGKVTACGWICDMIRDLAQIGLWKIQRQQFQTACVEAMKRVTTTNLTKDMKQLAKVENLNSMDHTFIKVTVNGML